MSASESAFSHTWGAWSFAEQPRRIAVVGCGVSGAEVASACARLGAEVLIFEAIDQILTVEDRAMSKVLEGTFRRQGIEIWTGTPRGRHRGRPGLRQAHLRRKAGEVDYLFIAGGRAPDVASLGLGGAGIEVERNGQIKGWAPTWSATGRAA